MILTENCASAAVNQRREAVCKARKCKLADLVIKHGRSSVVAIELFEPMSRARANTFDPGLFSKFIA